MWNNDELEFFINEDGERMVTLSISSNMLPHISVDTYQMWTTDSWEEQELANLGEDEPRWGSCRGRVALDLSWDDYEFTYDHSRFLEQLSDACIEAMTNRSDGMFEMGERESTYSPNYYNFETDSFSAPYTLNLTELILWGRGRSEWRGMKLEDAVEGYLRLRYTSYDGFHSFVTPALDDDNRRLATLVWGLFHAWLDEAFGDDRDSWLYGVYESFDEICRDTITLNLTVEGWEKNKDAVVANEDSYLLPDDDEVREEYAMMRAEVEKYQQAETLPGIEV